MRAYNTLLDGLGDLLDEGQDGVDDGALELEAPLLAQRVGQERQQHRVLLGVLEAERADGVHHDDLELVRDVRHEPCDLLHEPVHRGLGPRLEQRRDGKRRDGAVAVADHVLQVHVARRDRHGEGHGHPVQRAHCREAQHGLGGGEEELQHRHRRVELLLRDARQLADGAGGLEDDHIGAAAQRGLEEVVVRAVRGRRVAHDRRRVAHQQTVRQRRLGRRSDEAGDELGEGEAVGALDGVQQRERVVLHHLRRLVRRGLVDLVDPPLHNLAVGPHQLHARHERRRRHQRLLVHDGLLEVALDGGEHGRVRDGAKHPDGVGAVQVVGGVHVLRERAGNNDDAIRIGLQLLDHQVHHSAELFIF
mmetsp:Transcript_1088/g.2807  ORF Transcript_1088/g.2807 Transcript_1088/m.2807 type:complete len:362 (-) Transcript_1088:257-1342(-)